MTTQQQQQDVDPFASSDKHPSIRWETPGKTITGRVVERPAQVQSRDFDTGNPAFWPDGNPKYTVVTTLDIGGEIMSLWAAKPSALFGALAEAQRQAGVAIQPGGVLTVVYTGDIPNAKNPRLNPAKQFRATYQPPNPLTPAVSPVAAPADQPPF